MSSPLMRLIICAIGLFLQFGAQSAAKNCYKPHSPKIIQSLIQTKSKHEPLFINKLFSIQGGEIKVRNKSNSLFSPVSHMLGWIRGKLSMLLFSPSKSISKKSANNKSPKLGQNSINGRDSSSIRIQKEIQSFLYDPPQYTELTIDKSNIRSWTVTLTGVPDTIFAGETHQLRLTFPKDYPSRPPSVYFLKPTPKHVHVYSNGDICLSILGKDWRPTMTAQAIVVSIQAMLSSARERAMPQDNAMHADETPGKYQRDWMYHDDRC